MAARKTASKPVKAEEPQEPEYPKYTLVTDEIGCMLVNEQTEPGFVAAIAGIGCVEKAYAKNPAPSLFYPYWYLKWPQTSGRPVSRNSMDFGGPAVGVMRFKSKEDAFEFAVAVRRKVLSEIARRPLPDEINDHLALRARSVRDRQEALRSQMLDLRIEAAALAGFGEKFGIPDVTMFVDKSDAATALKDLCDFEVGVEGEKDPVPLLSETALYPLIGKDAARSVLARLRTLRRAIAPDSL